MRLENLENKDEYKNAELLVDLTLNKILNVNLHNNKSLSVFLLFLFIFNKIVNVSVNIFIILIEYLKYRIDKLYLYIYEYLENTRNTQD